MLFSLEWTKYPPLWHDLHLHFQCLHWMPISPCHLCYILEFALHTIKTSLGPTIFREGVRHWLAAAERFTTQKSPWPDWMTGRLSAVCHTISGIFFLPPLYHRSSCTSFCERGQQRLLSAEFDWRWKDSNPQPSGPNALNFSHSTTASH